MHKIFISYRRGDSRTITNRIYDRLVKAYCKRNVFKDVNSILAGEDFRGVLKKATSNCEVMLVIIGDKWADIEDSHGNRRLDSLEDFVRIEVETGLQVDGIRVIPVLVNGASPPPQSGLPTSLQQLAFINAIEVRDDPDFHNDMDRLIKQIGSNGLSFPCSILRWILALVIAIAVIFGLVRNQQDITLTVTPTEAVILTPTPSNVVTTTEIPAPIPTTAPNFGVSTAMPDEVIVDETNFLQAFNAWNAANGNENVALHDDLISLANREMGRIARLSHSVLSTNPEMAYTDHNGNDMSTLAQNIYGYEGVVRPYFHIEPSREVTMARIMDGVADQYGEPLNMPVESVGVAFRETLAGDGSVYILILFGSNQ